MGNDEAQAGGDGRGTRNRDGGGEARARWRHGVKWEMGGRSSGGGDLGEAGEEKGGDAKEIRNGKLLSPKGIEGMEVVMEFGGGFVGRLSDELMKIKAHSAAVFNCEGVKGVSMIHERSSRSYIWRACHEPPCWRRSQLCGKSRF